MWQRCYVHFLRNATDYVPREVDDDCLQELRWIYDRRDLAEVRRDNAAWLVKWQTKYRKRCDWAEDNIEVGERQPIVSERLPQAREVDQRARAPQSGDQAAHPRRAHLPQHGELLAPGAGAGPRTRAGARIVPKLPPAAAYAIACWVPNSCLTWGFHQDVA
jgi:hypothetical protein